jgi:ATP-dependent Lon protease
LKYIIERYTCEPGVRKLKELLFEIVGEMNIHHIKNKTCIQELPITLTNEEIKMKIFCFLRKTLKTKRDLVQIPS